ncbi:alpha/beta hydrolase [Robertkochia marina]|uniref:Alpha/beta hydrolase n=1 Tax=Robertkochia marina TaxID=1227945 RepID=A0A4S3M2M9_9FLAO|nr:alpha/beta hydrolase [Robertkochia marina]THD69392.1 alpha/beta hydrolase [Robertkochia marina]TRZ47347.1 alpha/beta hydrolase [Robertkochia marina]
MELAYKGTQIFYTDEGKGTAVILLHGFLENSSIWEGLKSHLVERNRVVCIDLLGHGATGCLGYMHTMTMMAEAVKAVLDHLRLRKVVLAGHSMGGYVALAFAEMYADHVKGLALVNSTPLPDSDEKKRNRDRAIAAVKQNHKSFIRVAVANLFRPKNRKIFAREIGVLKKEALKTPLQGIVAALEGMKIRPDREVLMHFTPYPKMVVLGKKDPVMDVELLRNRLKYTDVEVVVYPDGHMSYLENSAVLQQDLGIWLKKI